jgi:purine nucleosidase
MNRLVIDTDSVVDDAHAIVMAFAHSEAQIEEITTVASDVSLERATANACIILNVLERDVPVYAGCGRALVAEDTPDASFAMGQDGLGDSGYPRSKRKVADEHAVHALIWIPNGCGH